MGPGISSLQIQSPLSAVDRLPVAAAQDFLLPPSLSLFIGILKELEDLDVSLTGLASNFTPVTLLCE